MTTRFLRDFDRQHGLMRQAVYLDESFRHREPLRERLAFAFLCSAFLVLLGAGIWVVLAIGRALLAGGGH